MEKEVLDIITENLANERLDNIAVENKKYVQAEEEANRKQELLEKTLNGKQYRLFEDYLSAENHRMAVYADISYKQGMKDLASLMMSLLSLS